MCYDRATLGTSELNALQFSLLFDNQRATIICRLLKSLKTSFAKDVLNRSSSGAEHRSLDNCFHHFSVFDDFDSIKRSFFGNIFLAVYATQGTELQSHGITNLEKVKENGNNFSTRHNPLSSFLELIHLPNLFYLHRIDQVPR